MDWEEVPVTLECSDMPLIPGGLPIKCDISVTSDGIDFHAIRVGSLAADVDFRFSISRDQLIDAEITIRADVPDDFEYGPWNQPEVSEMVFRHRDPYEIVPHFTTKVSSPKYYWIRALGKYVRERLKMELIERPTSSEGQT
jgi:hypothetical protein